MNKIYKYKVTETKVYWLDVEAGSRESAYDKLDTMTEEDAVGKKPVEKDVEFLEADEIMTEDDDSDLEDRPVNEGLENEKAEEVKNEL